MSIIGSRVLGGAGQQPYLVGRSVRFRSSASAYLNRTPASSGTNLTKWTLSFWMKRGALSVQSVPFSAQDTPGTGASSIYFLIGSGNTIGVFYPNTGSTLNVGTAAVLRDPSAWYHVVFTWDTTQVTSTDRIKIYINGVQQTLSGGGTFPSLNATTTWNSNCAHFISKNPVASSDYFDGYFAEIYNIDGQALTPSSFGAYDNNGIWQPRKYGGTYGTNGFYLNFSDNSAATAAAIGKDYSGNGNNWTPNNISLTAGTTYDSMIDSPTVSASSSNYCVFNPVQPQSNVTFSEGNLKATHTTNQTVDTTMAVSSGKWYFELTVGAIGTRVEVGLAKSYNWAVEYLSTGTKTVNGVNTAYGATWTTGDIIGCAFDLDGSTATFYKNGVSQGQITGIVYYSDLNFPTTYGNGTPNYYLNFGQRPFSYTPPTGYNSFNTQNLPQPTIMNGAKYMAATLWTGDGTNPRTITNTVNNAAFQPDFIWTKVRSTTYSNTLYDDVRGGANVLFSDTTSAESQNYANGQILSFNSNGFNVNSGVVLNQSSQTYVGWQWNAGSGTTSTNTNGSISSLVSVNASAGFSIVSYVGNGTAGATVGHGLGAAPSFIIIKNRTDASNWAIYHVSVGNTKALLFDTSTGSTLTAYWNDTSPTSSVYTVGTANITNGSSKSMIAYCWSAVAGYSAFGSYTGNGSADGAFIYTGFRPRYILHKASSTTSQWMIWDTSRNTYNVLTNAELLANSSAAEGSGAWGTEIDILSNGFKFRGFDNSNFNYTGITYIYAAFAENPFKISRAR